MAIGPTRPVRSVTPSGYHQISPEERQAMVPKRDKPVSDRETAEELSVEIDSSLFAKLREMDQDAGENHGPEDYAAPPQSSPWDLQATVRALALDLDLLLSGLFGAEDSTAHDVAFTVIQTLSRRVGSWYALPDHGFLVTTRSILMIDAEAQISLVPGDATLVIKDAPNIVEGVPSERCRPGLHHSGETASWLRIEAVIHEIRARLGHIDFRRMRASTLEGRASQGLISAVILHAEGSRRGMTSGERSMLVFDTATRLIAKTEDDPIAVRVKA